MDDFNIGEIPKIDLPNIDVPITHDVPKTTIESLLQLKSEISKRVQEAAAANDSSKKRRYERQVKQFDDAIKATREGKAFNYAELVVPPGFAKIPLQSDGRPIGGGGGAAQTRPTPQQPSSQPNRASQQQPSRPAPAPPPAAKPAVSNSDEVDDDLLAALENEADNMDDDDHHDHHNDPELDRINKQINSLMPSIKKAIPKDQHMDIDDDNDDGGDGEVDDDFLAKMEKLIAKPDAAPGKGSKGGKPPQQQQQLGPIVNPPRVVAPKPAAVSNKTGNKDLNVLIERQRLFKEAALQAKKEGNTNVALVYLRHAKGFDQMILAAENGLPLDMSNLPVPPQLSKKHSPNSSINVHAAAATTTIATGASKPLDLEPISGDRKAVYLRLEASLKEQITTATRFQKNYTNLGDVHNAKKFQEIARENLQDLDALKSAYQHDQPVPLYHFEKRAYQMIDSNPDLTDNDLEIQIVRALNLPLPKDFEAKHMTTYVKFEFPYPPESIQTDKTGKQSGTLNPEFDQTFKVQIQRKQQKFVRLMNRKDLKFEIYYKAGLLKGDKLLASCAVKLQQLENSSTIHDAFDLLDGRRQTGAKLEVKIRIREPLLHKQVQVSEHKWLVIDRFVNTSPSGGSSKAKDTNNSKMTF